MSERGSLVASAESPPCYTAPVNPQDLGGLPDVRDGLTRLERAILLELARAQEELGGRNVPTAMLYGRVVEHVNVGVPQFQRALERLIGAPYHAGTAKPR